MNQNQAFVKAFHEKYGCPSKDTPTRLSEKDRLRRARLICSEAAEFLESADKDDFVGMVDALGDILYVTYGTAVEMGVDLEPIVAEIQRSNMSKDGGKDAGGKILKGDSFVEPDLEGVLKSQGWNNE